MTFVVTPLKSCCCQCSEWKRKRTTTKHSLSQDKVYQPTRLGKPLLYHQFGEPTLELSFVPTRRGVVGLDKFASVGTWQVQPCRCCDSSYFFDYGEHVSVELKQFQVVSGGSHCLLVLSRTETDTIGEKYDQLAKDYEASKETCENFSVDKSLSNLLKSETTGSSFSKTSRVLPIFMSVNESAELIQTIQRQSGHHMISQYWYGYGSNALLNFARLLYFLRKTLHVMGLVENMARISHPKNILKPILSLLKRVINHTKYPTFQACFYEWMVNDVGFEVEQVVLHGVNSSNMISDVRKQDERSDSQASSYSDALNRESGTKSNNSSIYASCRLPTTRRDDWIRARLCLAKNGKQFFVNLPPWDALGLAFLASLQIPIYVHASLWIRSSTSKGHIPCYDSRISVTPMNNDKQNNAHRSSLDETVMKSKQPREERKWNSTPSTPFAHNSLPFGAQRHSIPFHSPGIHQIIPFRRPADQKPTRFIPFTEDVRQSLREMLTQGEFTEAKQLMAQLPSLQWELEILDAIKREDYLTASRLQSKLKMVMQLEKILLRNKEERSCEEDKETENSEESKEDDRNERDSEEKKP